MTYWTKGSIKQVNARANVTYKESLIAKYVFKTLTEITIKDIYTLHQQDIGKNEYTQSKIIGETAYWLWIYI